MLSTDPQLMRSRLTEMTEATKATLRTTRIPPRHVNSTVEKRQSDVHGVGLFATSDVDKGDMLTSFPVDCSLYSDENGLPKACYSVLIEWDRLKNGGAADAVLENRSFAHIVTSDGVPLSMALESMVPYCPGHLAHWANDAASMPDTSHCSNKERKAIEKSYLTESFVGTNAQHASLADGIFVFAVATRPIKKGEEILVSYGVDWWSSWNAVNHADKIVRGDEGDKIPHVFSEEPGDGGGQSSVQ